MNANNVWVDSTAGEEVVEARLHMWCGAFFFSEAACFLIGTFSLHTKLFETQRCSITAPERTVVVRYRACAVRGLNGRFHKIERERWG